MDAQSNSELPAVFAPFEPFFLQQGHALDLACGSGGASLWMAARGLEVVGVDVSRVAVSIAEGRAAELEVSCRSSMVDLDNGLPARDLSLPSSSVICSGTRSWTGRSSPG